MLQNFFINPLNLEIFGKDLCLTIYNYNNLFSNNSCFNNFDIVVDNIMKFEKEMDKNNLNEYSESESLGNLKELENVIDNKKNFKLALKNDSSLKTSIPLHKRAKSLHKMKSDCSKKNDAIKSENCILNSTKV